MIAVDLDLAMNVIRRYGNVGDSLANGPGDADVYINPADFRAIVAADRSIGQAAVMAAEQRPVSGLRTPSIRGQQRNCPAGI